jgi:DNA processing protein
MTLRIIHSWDHPRLSRCGFLRLYIHGELPDGIIVGIAGTRNPTPHGVEVTRGIVRGLVEGGLAIATGLARGVDWVATLTALELSGKVIGVPPYFNNRARFVVERGGVVITPQVEPGGNIKRLFAERDGVLACISDVLIIPEARYRSEGWGTRITVDFVRRLNKPVFVVKPSDDAPSDVKRGFEELVKRFGAISISNYDSLRDVILNGLKP